MYSRTSLIPFLLTCLLRGMTVLQPPYFTGFLFLLTCLLRGMTGGVVYLKPSPLVSTHMPLARHDIARWRLNIKCWVSTHMPLARHDNGYYGAEQEFEVSTHMPLARHDEKRQVHKIQLFSFYSHASCEA